MKNNKSTNQLSKVSHGLRNRLIALVLLIILFSAVFLSIPKLHEVTRVIGHMDIRWVIVAIAFEVISCAGYIVIFLRIFSRLPTRFGARVALSELAFGGAVSLGGAGSIMVGGWLLVDKGIPLKRVAERSAVLFLFTSAVNLGTLIVASAAVLSHLVNGTRHVSLSLVPLCVGVLILLIILSIPLIAKALVGIGLEGRIKNFIVASANTIVETEKLLIKPDWRSLGAVVYLWADIAVLVCCFAALGKIPPLGNIVLAYQLGLLANFIPIPGNLGTLDASIVGMFLLFGVDFSLATAATVVYHAIMLFIPALFGSIAFIILRHNRNEPIKLKPASSAS